MSKPPESRSEANSSPEASSNRLKSHEHFAQAKKVVRLISEDWDRTDTSLKVSIELALCGRDLLSPLGEYQQIARVRPDQKPSGVWETTNGIYEAIALLGVASGDLHNAIRTGLEHTFKHPWLFGKMATIASAKNIDPTPALDEAWKTLRGNDTFEAVKVAGVHRHLVGVVPQHYIDRFSREGFSKDPDYCSHQTMQLAKLYAVAGYPDQAVEYWRKTNPDKFGRRVEALADVAESFAKAGKDPLPLLNQASEMIEGLESTDRFDPTYIRPELYARLSRAAGTANRDHQRYYIERALEKAMLDQSNLRIDSFIIIAQTQFSIGLDPEPLIGRALEELERHFPEDNKNGFDTALKVISLVEIFRLRLEAGHYHEAAGILDWFKERQRTDPDDFYYIEEAKLLSELAQAEHRGTYLNWDV